MAESDRPTTVFLGDSLTEQGKWAERFPELDVVNLGVSGDTTEQVLERLPEVIEKKPSTIVVMVGTNDLAWRRGAEQIVRNLESILWRLHHELPAARILVQSVLPRDRELADRVREINIHIRQYSPTVKAEWVDLWPVFAEEDGEIKADYSDDRLHLNEAGYAAWAEELRRHL
ncbi:GDSL-type esterase/lipase family protein [Naasia sp. SYSU D00948]|uniref:GDSL-type esterase/lipase family protein n=1 Tax=Naasia sp. SYSU D00948 TaxID=2817379 RepID=UPI001B30B860|nr:GDSL-type esterase/lipase family protein [Naasia sp. SYSU D00948]